MINATTQTRKKLKPKTCINARVKSQLIQMKLKKGKKIKGKTSYPRFLHPNTN